MSAVEIVGVSTLSVALWIVVSGFVFAKVKGEDEETRLIIAALWPLAAVFYLAWWLATLAPRWAKRRELAKSTLPKATARDVK